MAIPFASAYTPINLLNDAIQNQAARQQQGYLQASALNDASVADSLNRIVQQKALAEQAANQRAHYGLQQQQLANDLAYRNAALREAEARSIEQARQFDKQFGLNERIANAQINNPFYGQKDALAFGMQAKQEVDAANAAAASIASQATGALKSARATRDAELAQLKDPSYFEMLKRTGLVHKTFGTQDVADLEAGIRKKYADAVSAIEDKLGPLRTKVKLVGDAAIDGEYQPVLLSPPTFPGMMPQAQPFDGSEGPNVGPVSIGTPDFNTQENQPTPGRNPFLTFFTGPAGC